MIDGSMIFLIVLFCILHYIGMVFVAALAHEIKHSSKYFAIWIWELTIIVLAIILICKQVYKFHMDFYDQVRYLVSKGKKKD